MLGQIKLQWLLLHDSYFIISSYKERDIGVIRMQDEVANIKFS